MNNLIEQYRSGKSLRHLEIEFSMSRKTIKKILQSNGIGIKTNKQTYLVEDEIMNLYQSGLSGKHIADKLGISPPTLYDKLRNMGLSLKNRKYPERQGDCLSSLLQNGDQNNENGLASNNNKCKYYVNENFFNKIDCENKAYLLGLWCADGNVHNNTARLVLKDKELVELAKNILGFTGPIKTIVKKNGKVYHKLSISRISIVKDLVAAGCVPCKSLILKFPTSDIVPENFTIHFIRGLFDGDGTIFKSKRGNWCVGFVGTSEIVTNIANKIGCIGKLRHHKSKKNTWWLVCEKHSEIKRVIEYIYKDSTVALKRKAIKANEFLQHIYERSL